MMPIRKSLLVVLFATLTCVTALLAFINLELRKSLDGVKSASAVEAGKPKCHKYRLSQLANQYLENLHGVEIGASTQNSFGLKRSINIDFSDEQGGLWQDKACEPAVVNIVAFGDDLPFKDGTLDYVLSSHVIEHFFDPVKALREWHRVIKRGGYIFIIAPHMDRTFDRHRDATTVSELIDRSTGKIKIANYAKPLNQQALEGTGKEHLGPFSEVLPQQLFRGEGTFRLKQGWAYYETDDHHHWSAWRTGDFVELVKRLNLNIVALQDIDDKVGNGFTVVIRK